MPKGAYNWNGKNKVSSRRCFDWSSTYIRNYTVCTTVDTQECVEPNTLAHVHSRGQHHLQQCMHTRELAHSYSLKSYTTRGNHKEVSYVQYLGLALVYTIVTQALCSVFITQPHSRTVCITILVVHCQFMLESKLLRLFCCRLQHKTQCSAHIDLHKRGNTLHNSKSTTTRLTGQPSGANGQQRTTDGLHSENCLLQHYHSTCTNYS